MKRRTGIAILVLVILLLCVAGVLLVRWNTGSVQNLTFISRQGGTISFEMVWGNVSDHWMLNMSEFALEVQTNGVWKKTLPHVDVKGVRFVAPDRFALDFGEPEIGEPWRLRLHARLMFWPAMIGDKLGKLRWLALPLKSATCISDTIQPAFPTFVPLGAKTLLSGALLYEPHSRQYMGTVLQTSFAHEFENGNIVTGVLLKNRHGREAWVERTNLNKALVPGK